MLFSKVRRVWLEIAIYSSDLTILDYVGVGGIGMYLRETVEMLDYSKTGMTLIVIIGHVIVSELVSAQAGKRIM